MQKLKLRWTNLPQPVYEILAYGLIAGIGYLDYLTGTEISFSIFYVFPVLFLAWNAGKPKGIMLAVIAVVVEYLVDMAGGHTYSHNLIAFWNVLVHLGFILIIIHLVFMLKANMESVERSSKTDFLTGVDNRRSFYEAAGQEIKRLPRYKHPFAVMYIDLDDFKLVNDKYGHQEGDAVLQVVARTIEEAIRDTDRVARLGGDEFAVLFPEINLAESQAIAQRLKNLLDEKMCERQWPITFSIGAGLFVQAPASVDEMIRKTDRLMYLAKNQGKDKINQMVFEN